MLLKGSFMRQISIIFCTILLTACFSTQPINNEQFGSISKLSDLNGSYRNLGDSGTEGPEIYLSEIIWPNEESINHSSIEAILVSSVTESQLSVKAMKLNNVIKEQIFIEGKDFNLSSGRIQLVREMGGINDNFAGATYTSAVLGLDASGHGKFQRSETFAGIALMIPIVAQGTTDVKFYKIEK